MILTTEVIAALQKVQVAAGRITDLYGDIRDDTDFTKRFPPVLMADNSYKQEYAEIPVYVKYLDALREAVKEFDAAEQKIEDYFAAIAQTRLDL
jgi:hypothetical protein